MTKQNSVQAKLSSAEKAWMMFISLSHRNQPTKLPTSQPQVTICPPAED